MGIEELELDFAVWPRARAAGAGGVMEGNPALRSGDTEVTLIEGLELLLEGDR